MKQPQPQPLVERKAVYEVVIPTTAHDRQVPALTERLEREVELQFGPSAKVTLKKLGQKRVRS